MHTTITHLKQRSLVDECSCAMFRDEWIRAIESVSERLQVLEGQDEPMDQDDDSMAVSFGKRKKIVRLW